MTGVPQQPPAQIEQHEILVVKTQPVKNFTNGFPIAPQTSTPHADPLKEITQPNVEAAKPPAIIPHAVQANIPQAPVVSQSPPLHIQSEIPTAKPKQQTSLGVKLLCGAVAGITGTCVIYPMDMVKTRLQNQSRNPTATSVRYTGGLDALKTIIRTEGGYRALYRGLPANLVGITPEKAIKLAVNDYAREWFAKGQLQRQINASKDEATKAKLRAQGPDPDNLSIPLGMASGAIAGTCQVVATNPMEIIKINSQMATLHAKQTNTVAKSSWEITKELGLRGVYKGTPATLMRDVPFSFIFFPLSSYLKQRAAEKDKKNGGIGKAPFSSVFISGIGAGCVAAVAVTPADVIKTRLQTKGAAEQGATIRSVATKILREEGPKAFFKGAPQRGLIIAPLFGITLLVYEAQQRLFGGIKK